MKNPQINGKEAFSVLTAAILLCGGCTSPAHSEAQASASRVPQNGTAQGGEAARKTGADPTSAPTITFDRNKISHDDVVAAVSSIFLAHGYKTSAQQMSVYRVQDSQPTTQLQSGGPIRFIDTELQPSLSVSDSQEPWRSKPWHYKALINDDNVELDVYVKADPIQFKGIVFDESKVPLQPPDMKAIVQELRTKLQ